MHIAKTGRRLFAASLLALAAAAALGAEATAAAPAASSDAPATPAAQTPAMFARWPAMRDVAISPSGKHLALIVPGAKGRSDLATMDLDPLGNTKIVAAFDDANVTGVAWANDDRLIYTAVQPGVMVDRGGGGTWAVDRDGTAPRQLIAAISDQFDVTDSEMSSRLLTGEWSVAGVIDDDSADVFVSKEHRTGTGESDGSEIFRLDTRTGIRHALGYGLPDHVVGWLLDDKGQMRMLTATSQGRERIYWRPGNDGPWQEVGNFDATQEPGFTPWAIDADGQIFVRTRADGDTVGIYKFDPVARKIAAAPEVHVAGYDIDAGSAIHDSRTRKLLGLHIDADRPLTYWFDARMDKLQRGVDQALPDRVNELLCERCSATHRFVVFSHSDRQPGEYFLYDSDKGALQRIGAQRPWIDEKLQPRRTLEHFAARDGLQIPVVVTHPLGVPAGQKPAAVMLVHGGPYVRGSDTDWDPEAAWFASRGYVVLQPQYRSSTGFGWKLFHTGWKHWGDTMQDDLADAVQWAGAQGLVDPSRVCIVGGSYGGYAALMSPIVHPELYRCSIAFAAVSDIDLMYSVTWSDANEEWLRYGMPVMIGDREKDADLLKRASPLQRVDGFKIPLLLMHGSLDQRVPIEHEREFAAAARKAGVNLEEVIFPDAVHGFADEAGWTDYYRREGAFLAKYLQAPVAPAKTQP